MSLNTNNWLQSIKHQRNLPFLVVMVVLMIFLLFAFVKITNLVAEQRTNLVEQRQEMENRLALSEDYSRLQASLTQIQSEGEVMNRLIPNENNLLFHLEILEQGARNHQLSQQINIVEAQSTRRTRETSVRTITMPTGMQAVNIAINLRGQYANVIEYLDFLENIHMLTHFTRVDLRAEKQSSGSIETARNTGEVSARVEGQIFLTQ